MNNTGIREAAQHSFGLSGAQLPENLEAWPENPVPAEPAAPPLDCEAAARRAAADAETGGPEGRPAFAAPKRRPPREGEINTGRILLRLRHDRVKVRSLAPPRAYGRARRARSPRRSSRARGDSGDGSGEAAGPASLPENIEEWPNPPFNHAADYRAWRGREEKRENRRGLIRIDSRIGSAAKNHRWTPRWWEDEEWADRLIKYGRPNGRERGEALLAALKDTSDVFHVLVIDHPIFKDAVGELPHDLRLAPGDRVAIEGVAYKWRSNKPGCKPKEYRPSLAFIPRDFILLSSPYATLRTPAVRALSNPDEIPGHIHQKALYELYGADWPARVASNKEALDDPKLWRWRSHTKQRVYDACVRIECERLGLAPPSLETDGA